MTKQDKASHYFGNGFNCAQSVFAAFSPGLGISEEDSLKTACAFGGGIGRQQLVCGAVTGGLMVLGAKFGKGIRDAEEKKQETYALAREFCNEFAHRHGSLNCSDLLMGLNMNDPEDNQRIKELGLSETHCTRYVRDAVEIADNISRNNAL